MTVLLSLKDPNAYGVALPAVGLDCGLHPPLRVTMVDYALCSG